MSKLCIFFYLDSADGNLPSPPSCFAEMKKHSSLRRRGAKTRLSWMEGVLTRVRDSTWAREEGREEEEEEESVSQS